MAVIYESLKVAYAKAIYKDYTKKFVDIRAEYVEPVKQYAAANYDQSTLDNALLAGNITAQEYDDTMAYKVA